VVVEEAAAVVAAAAVVVVVALPEGVALALGAAACYNQSRRLEQHKH
jgi:hypothetical protein